jgi:hypothetical protein
MQNNNSSVNANTTKTIGNVGPAVGSDVAPAVGSDVAPHVVQETNSQPSLNSDYVFTLNSDYVFTLNSNYVFTLHLPGLKKTVPFHWPKKDTTTGNSLVIRQEFFNSICDTFGVVTRRANIYRLTPEKAEKIYSCNGRGLEEIFDGDTIILAVRGTKDDSLNEYYKTQLDSLMNNQYLDPPISKDNAVFLLTQLAFNFDMDRFFGYKHYLPGGTCYETTKNYNNKVQNYV